jgi:hypothetical protein
MNLRPKTVRFIQVIGVAVLLTALKAVADNLGASGLVSAGTAAFVTAIIGVIEQAVSGPSGAIFGAITIRR